MEERVDLLPKRSFEPGKPVIIWSPVDQCRESHNVLGDAQSAIFIKSERFLSPRVAPFLTNAYWYVR
jgi:hypothetical protein